MRKYLVPSTIFQKYLMFIIPPKLAAKYYLYIGKMYLSEYFSNYAEMPVDTKL